MRRERRRAGGRARRERLTSVSIRCRHRMFSATTDFSFPAFFGGRTVLFGFSPPFFPFPAGAFFLPPPWVRRGGVRW